MGKFYSTKRYSNDRGLFCCFRHMRSTPYGIFNSVAECMKKLNLTRHQVYVNIEKLEDWFYIKNTEDMI
jgi:hypothetical protein